MSHGFLQYGHPDQDDMTSTRTPKPQTVLDKQNKAVQKVAKSAAQEIRLIGGIWRRTPLPVPASAGLRPTPSRVRETLFNWLGQDLSGWKVLDAFAGSGALGLEAASRGATEVWLLERESDLVRRLQATQARLKAEQVHIVRTDALSWMHQPLRLGYFDLVFLDPPFDDNLFWAALEAALLCVPIGGWIYLESPTPLASLPQAETKVDVMACLQVHRSGQAGTVHFHLLRRVG